MDRLGLHRLMNSSFDHRGAETMHSLFTVAFSCSVIVSRFPRSIIQTCKLVSRSFNADCFHYHKGIIQYCNLTMHGSREAVNIPRPKRLYYSVNAKEAMIPLVIHFNVWFDPFFRCPMRKFSKYISVIT